MKNFATLLLLSAGVPMILGGDEFGRTQRGNNNAYCQDVPWNWFDWQQVEHEAGLVRFFQLLIRFRLAHTELRPVSFEDRENEPGPQRDWHGIQLGRPDWSETSHSLAMHVYHPHRTVLSGGLYIIANAYSEVLSFQIPDLADQAWLRVIDTSAESPYDIHPPGNESRVAGRVILAKPRSVLVLKAARAGITHHPA